MMPSLHSSHSPLAQAKRTRSRSTLPGAGTVKRAPGRSLSRRLTDHERDLLNELLHGKYEYVDHELFHQDTEEQIHHAVFVEPDAVPVPDTSWYAPLMDTATAVDPNRLSNQGSVLLTAAQERVIFTQFNECRRRVCLLRDELALQPEDRRDPAKERELLDWYKRADAIRSQIADTNLALVLAMAKRTRMNPTDFPDLISEGNMALLRAVDKFDVGRGFKFSTYACRAILKAFSRQGIKFTKHRQMFPAEFDPKLERSNYQAERNAQREDDAADEVRRIVQSNRAELSNVERTVVAARFNVAPAVEWVDGEPVARDDANDIKRQAQRAISGVTDADEQDSQAFVVPRQLLNRDPDEKPMTLEQVGKLIGVTKERVRQIQNKALEKIRHTLEEEYLA